MVVDASALIEVLLRTPAADAVSRRLETSSEPLHSPHLLDVEVAHVLRRYEANGVIDRDRGRSAIVDLGEFPVRRHPHFLLLTRVWELRYNVTAYDGMYIALAEALAEPLLTRDRRLAAAAGHRARVELV